MFLRKMDDQRRLAALNAPPLSLAVAGKWIMASLLAIAGIVVVSTNNHLFGPPLLALLLTAAVAAVIVSLRPRAFRLSQSGHALDSEQDAGVGISGQSLFLLSPTPGILVDCATGEIASANSAAEELYGYPLEELRRLSLNSLMASEGAGKAAESNLPTNGLTEHRRADGSVIRVDLQSRRIQHDGRPAWLVVVNDVSARLQLVQELEASERHLRELVELSFGIVFTHDIDGTVLMVNSAFARALGHSVESLSGQSLVEHIVPRHRDAFTRYLHKVSETGSDSGAVHMQRADGSEQVWEFRNLLRASADGSKSVLCCAIDISERSRNERRLLETSRKDALSGCYDRDHLEVFEEDADPTARWAAIVIDIDHLKHCNESHGHRAGDQAIVRTARTLEGMVRKEDSIVRIGGDKFVILLRQCDQATLESFAVRLQRAKTQQETIPFSFGLAMRKDGENLEQTIDRADRQMIERRFIERSNVRLDEKKLARHAIQREPTMHVG